MSFRPSPVLGRVLSAYAALMRRRFEARLRFVRLYGSYARGGATESSDVDVAVVVEDLTREEWREAAGDAVAAEGDTGLVLSPLVLSGARFDELTRRGRAIARDILDEGVVQ